MDPLREALASADENERRRAVGAIGRQPRPDLAPDLVRLLATEPNDWVRSEVAGALGRLAWRPALGELLSAARHDRAPVVRAQACWALGRIWTAGPVDAEAYDRLWEALGDGEPSLGSTCVQTLAGLAASRPEIPGRLEAALRGARGPLRQHCAAALGLAGAVSSIGVLVDAFRTPGGEPGPAAIEALKRLGQRHGAAALGPLCAVLQDRSLHASWRRAAAAVLGYPIEASLPAHLPPDLTSAVCEALLAAVDDLNPDVGADARMLIERLHGHVDEAAQQRLRSGLEARRTANARAALALLPVRPGDSGDTAVLLALLDSPDWERALQALEQRGAFDLPLAVRLLGDERMRWAAARRLAAIGDPQATQPLLAALDTEGARCERDLEAGFPRNPGTTVSILEALAALGDADVLPAMIAVVPLEDAVTAPGGLCIDAAAPALEALCRRLGPVAAPPLLAALDAGREEQRGTLVRALLRTGDPRAMEPARRFLLGAAGFSRPSLAALAIYRLLGDAGPDAVSILLELARLGSSEGEEALTRSLQRLARALADEPLREVLALPRHERQQLSHGHWFTQRVSFDRARELAGAELTRRAAERGLVTFPEDCGTRFVLTEGASTAGFGFGAGSWTIGEEPICDIYVRESGLGGLDARIDSDGEQVRLVSARGWRKARVDGEVVESVVLRDGAEIRLGVARFRFRHGEGPPTAAVEPIDGVFFTREPLPTARPVLSAAGSPVPPVPGRQPVTFLRFHSDGLLLVAAVDLEGDPASHWPAIDRWLHRDATPLQGRDGRHVLVLATRYRQGPTRVVFVERTVHEDRSYGWDDEPEMQEQFHVVECGGAYGRDEMTLEYEVGPPHRRQGRIACVRLGPARLPGA